MAFYRNIAFSEIELDPAFNEQDLLNIFEVLVLWDNCDPHSITMQKHIQCLIKFTAVFSQRGEHDNLVSYFHTLLSKCLQESGCSYTRALELTQNIPEYQSLAKPVFLELKRNDMDISNSLLRRIILEGFTSEIITEIIDMHKAQRFFMGMPRALSLLHFLDDSQVDLLRETYDFLSKDHFVLTEAQLTQNIYKQAVDYFSALLVLINPRESAQLSVMRKMANNIFAFYEKSGVVVPRAFFEMSSKLENLEQYNKLRAAREYIDSCFSKQSLGPEAIFRIDGFDPVRNSADFNALCTAMWMVCPDIETKVGSVVRNVKADFSLEFFYGFIKDYTTNGQVVKPTGQLLKNIRKQLITQAKDPVYAPLPLTYLYLIYSVYRIVNVPRTFNDKDKRFAAVFSQVVKKNRYSKETQKLILTTLLFQTKDIVMKNLVKRLLDTLDN